LSPRGALASSPRVRLALTIAYEGGAFHGWQTQPDGRGIQDVLEAALAQVAGHPVATICAGRTDAGVHAVAQVVHFDSMAARPLTAWLRGTNAHLPAGVAVQRAIQVDDGFHARYGALRRHYRYLILRGSVRHPLWHHRAAWVHQPLDLAAMHEAGALLLGEHDFSAFRSSQCQARSPVRRLERLAIGERDGLLMIDVCANAFLHHMVRNLVGALVWVGMGRRPVGWLGEVLASRDRRLAAPTMAAQGLYLSGVEYGDAWPTGPWPPIPVPF
jgi:tRNA pseudouridine38-40 synthase